MYTALGTQPDISYVVAVHSRHNSRPFTSHMTAAKIVHQYFKSTAICRLHINGNGIGIGNSLIEFSESDRAMESADRKSQGGHEFLPSNGAMLWQSPKDSFIAMSTPKAEFIAYSEASREEKWLLQLQKYIHGKDLPLLPNTCDNQGALTLNTMGIIKLEPSIWTIAITTVEICIDNK